MTGYKSKRAAARDKLLELAQEGMNMHSHDAPEYIVCEALIEALAQPAQEPWREFASDYERGVIDGRQKQMQSSVDKAVNAMTQRTWVGLTDEQIADYLGDEYHAMTESELRFFRLGETAAKEKNNG